MMVLAPRGSSLGHRRLADQKRFLLPANNFEALGTDTPCPLIAARCAAGPRLLRHFDKCGSPTSIEDFFPASFLRARKLVRILCGIVIQKHPLAAATPFAGEGAFRGMGQEIVQRAEQEAAEPAPLRVSPGQSTFSRRWTKKSCVRSCRILAAAAADEGVNWIAIKAIELFPNRAGFCGPSAESAATSPHWVVRTSVSRRVKRRIH
jgi:hypothetical protein